MMDLEDDSHYRIRRISHELFGGTLDLNKPFRALIAGGGTGKEAITLAYDMRALGMTGQVVQLDISEASSRIAKQWSDRLGLDIQFVIGSILDLEHLNLGLFELRPLLQQWSCSLAAVTSKVVVCCITWKTLTKA